MERGGGGRKVCPNMRSRGVFRPPVEASFFFTFPKFPLFPQFHIFQPPPKKQQHSYLLAWGGGCCCFCVILQTVWPLLEGGSGSSPSLEDLVMGWKKCKTQNRVTYRHQFEKRADNHIDSLLKFTQCRWADTKDSPTPYIKKRHFP